jgi:hypothetical protein
LLIAQHNHRIGAALQDLSYGRFEEAPRANRKRFQLLNFMQAIPT